MPVNADGTVEGMVVHKEPGQVPLVRLGSGGWVALDEFVLFTHDARFRRYAELFPDDPPAIVHIDGLWTNCALANLRWEPGDATSKFFLDYAKRAYR